MWNSFKISCPDAKEWYMGWIAKYKAHPKRYALLAIVKIPICLYLFMQLRPFIMDTPYAMVLVATIIPFFLFNALRKETQKSLTLTFLVITVVYFCVTKPLAFPPNPDSSRFDEKYFKFENYLYLHEAHIEFKKLFPVGTPKETVDRILIGYGGARSGNVDARENVFVYQYEQTIGPFLTWNWSVSMTFDNNMKITHRYDGKSDDVVIHSTGIQGL